MPNPTLYDNFSQVKQYIDQNQVDLSSYVSKTELANASYVTNNTLNSYLLEPSITKTYNGSLRLFPYGLNINNNAGTVYPNSISYSSLIVERENSWASVGSIRNYVNGRLAEIEASYVTSNTLNSYLSVENLNTAGTKMQLRTNGLTVISTTNSIAPKVLSYTDLVNNSTSNNWIGQTSLQNYVNGRLAEIEASYVTSNTLNSYLSTDNFTKPIGFDTIKLYDTGLSVSTVNGKIYPDWLSYSAVNGSTYNYSFISGGTLKNFINGRLAAIESTYATTSYVADYVAEHGGGGEVTYSYLSDNYLAKSGGTMTGQLTLNNGVKLHVGSERPWDIYEGGTEGNASLTIRNTVDGKHFYIKDINYNNIVDIHNNTTGTGAVKLSYNLNTYTNSIVPNSNNTYTLGNSNYYWSATYSYIVNIGANNRFKALDNYNVCFYMGNYGRFNILSSAIRPSSSGGMNLGTNDYHWNYTYTNNLILNGTDINQSISKGKWYIGTATTYTSSTTAYCTATVDTFELDGNGKPLTGTCAAFKVTSVNQLVTGAQMKINVNNTGQYAIYYNTGVRTSTGRDNITEPGQLNRYYYYIWDGSYWVYVHSSNEWTIGAMTDAEASAGTSTTARSIKPITLATYYASKSAVNGMFSYDTSTGTLTITTL